MDNLTQLVLIYTASINLISLLMFGVDKLKAKHDAWRLSERSLYLVSFLGGVFGSVLGMKIFRHKTRKTKFKIIISILAIWNVIIYLAVTDQFFYDIIGVI